MATGVASHLVSGWTAVSGIDVPKFEKMSRGFSFREGHGFERPNDILVDTYFAQQAKVHAGSTLKLFNRNWNVAGVVEPGKLAHIFLPLNVVQDLDGTNGKVAQIYLKVDDPANVQSVIGELSKLSSPITEDRKSTRLNSSHQIISYAVFCFKKKKKNSKA